MFVDVIYVVLCWQERLERHRQDLQFGGEQHELLYLC